MNVTLSNDLPVELSVRADDTLVVKVEVLCSVQLYYSQTILVNLRRHTRRVRLSHQTAELETNQGISDSVSRMSWTPVKN